MCVFQFWFLIGFKQIINKAESESNNKVVFETGKILSNLIQRSLVGQAYRQAFQRFIPISAFYPQFSFRFQFQFPPFSFSVLSQPEFSLQIYHAIWYPEPAILMELSASTSQTRPHFASAS